MTTTSQHSHLRRIRILNGIAAALAILLVLSPVARAKDKLIEVMPDDMFIGVHIERAQRIIEPSTLLPALTAAFESEADAKVFLEVIKQAPGPIVIGELLPEVPRRSDSDCVVAAVDLERPDADFHAYIEQTFLPALKILADKPEEFTAKLEKSAQGGRVLSGQGGECLFAYAIKDRRVVLSTNPQIPMRWARGEWPKRRWVQTPGVRTLLGKQPQESTIRLLINTEAIDRLMKQTQKQNSGKTEFRLFSEQAFRSVIGDLDVGKESVRISVKAAIIKDAQYFSKVLVRSPSKTQTLGVFPEEYVGLLRIGWNSASDVVDGVFGFFDTLDETIRQEYGEELKEFKEKTGVAWDRDILGNLVGEFVLGVRIDLMSNPPIGWTAVMPLRDEAAFKQAFNKLVDHFELTFAEREEGDLLLRTAVGTRSFTLAITQGHLLIGSTADGLIPIARNLKRPKHDLPISKNLRKCCKDLGESNHFAVMLDLAELHKRFPMFPAMLGAEFGPALMDGYVGFALTTEDEQARADLLWSLANADHSRAVPASQVSPQSAGEAMANLAVVLGKSLAAARRQSRAFIVLQRVRKLGTIAHQYAQDHKGAFPKDLEELVKHSDGAITLKELKNIYELTGPSSISEVNTKSYVIYRSGLTTNSDPAEVLIAERKVHDGAAHFLFVDGHVERVPEPRASELLQLIAEKADEIRR